MTLQRLPEMMEEATLLLLGKGTVIQCQACQVPAITRLMYQALCQGVMTSYLWEQTIGIWFCLCRDMMMKGEWQDEGISELINVRVKGQEKNHALQPRVTPMVAC